MRSTDLLTNRMLVEERVYVQHRKLAKPENIDPHSHTGYEIYFFQSGLATYIIGETIYTLKPGDMLLFNGQILHYVKPSFQVPYLRSVINVSRDYVDTLLTEPAKSEVMEMFDQPGGHLVHWPVGERELVEQIFNQIAEEDEMRDLGYQDMVRARLTTLLLSSLRKCSADFPQHPISTTSQKEINAGRVLAYINQQFQSTITLEAISEAVHLNKHYLCHCFKQITGFTIHQYLAKRRIDESKKLLVETDKSIAAIAEAVGIAAVAQFSRLFKQHVGMAPYAYRKSHRRLDGARMFAQSRYWPDVDYEI